MEQFKEYVNTQTVVAFLLGIGVMLLTLTFTIAWLIEKAKPAIANKLDIPWDHPTKRIVILVILMDIAMRQRDIAPGFLRQLAWCHVYETCEQGLEDALKELRESAAHRESDWPKQSQPV